MVQFDLIHSKKLKRIDDKIDDFRTRIKDSEDTKVKDDVFDTATLMALYKLASDGYLDALGGSISSGKEANIFHALRQLDQGQQELAVKIYRINTSNFKAMQEYLIGDIRFKNIRHTKKGIVLAWTQKEFRNLSRAKESGLNVPQPLISNRNILIMEFLGKENVAYPQLRYYNLNYEQAVVVYDKVEEFIVGLYKDAELVHGDLSEYNILLDPNSLTPAFIDMGQSMTLEHPMANDFLARDITNVAKFFNKFGLSVDEQALLAKVTKTRENNQ
jgi:RIO kinase 1